MSLRGRPFWRAQILGWTALHALSFFPMNAMVKIHGGTTAEVLFVNVFSAVLSIMVSTAIGWAFLRISEKKRLSDKSRNGFSFVLSVLMLCILGSVVISGVTWLGSWSSGIGPWLPEKLDNPFVFPAILMGRTLMTLCTWSAIFLVLILAKRVRIERERAIVASALAGEAQLDLLRSQLNPHFLFNALNSVVGLIGENPNKAEQMVRDIAGLLRRTLDDTNKPNTTVADEIEFLNLYLRCQKVRFESALQVEVEIQEQLLPLHFPSMLLHPLVENAVKHGMRNQKTLQLRISGRMEEDRVIMEIANSGEIASENPSLLSGTGTGVKTVKERISAIFPNNGTFSLVEDAGWVIATIEFTPASKETDPS